MKKSKIKKFATYTIVIALIGTCGTMKLCREKSEKFADKVVDFVEDFEEDEFLVAAHRGFSSIEVENSSLAFSTAADAKFVDYIEMDVRLTADNKLICAHNNSVVSSNGEKYRINKLMLDAGGNDTFVYNNVKFGDFFGSLFSDTEGTIIRERMSSLFGRTYSFCELKDALNLCGDKKIILDLKFNDNFDNFVEVLMENIKDFDSQQIILQSADLKLLGILQEMYPNYNYLAIVNSVDDFSYCDSFQMIGVRKNLIDSKYVDKAIEDGKHLSIWTINTTDELDNVVKSLGDDYEDVIYVTDYPDVISCQLDTISKQMKKVTTQ